MPVVVTPAFLKAFADQARERRGCKVLVIVDDPELQILADRVLQQTEEEKHRAGVYLSAGERIVAGPNQPASVVTDAGLKRAAQGRALK